jgi:hypothetical protein
MNPFKSVTLSNGTIIDPVMTGNRLEWVVRGGSWENMPHKLYKEFGVHEQKQLDDYRAGRI